MSIADLSTTAFCLVDLGLDLIDERDSGRHPTSDQRR